MNKLLFHMQNNEQMAWQKCAFECLHFVTENVFCALATNVFCVTSSSSNSNPFGISLQMVELQSLLLFGISLNQISHACFQHRLSCKMFQLLLFSTNFKNCLIASSKKHILTMHAFFSLL